MRFYIEITLLPCEEINLYFIWQKLYQQVHLRLVEYKVAEGKSQIGVSFPEYVCNPEKKHYHLGAKLRLFAKTEDELHKLNLSDSLSRFTDYVHIKSIQSVPDNIVRYATFNRVQTKSSIDRLARRYASRNKISVDEARTRYKGREENYSDLPYIRIRSASSNQEYRLLIGMTKKNNASNQANFSTYGLSPTNTVPVF